MRIVTSAHNDLTIVTESDGVESITYTTAHGKVEITVEDGVMTTQVFQAVSEVTMATVETSAAAYWAPDFPNTHNTEVIR